MKIKHNRDDLQIESAYVSFNVSFHLYFMYVCMSMF